MPPAGISCVKISQKSFCNDTKEVMVLVVRGVSLAITIFDKLAEYKWIESQHCIFHGLQLIGSSSGS